MERCDFASITHILRNNLLDGNFDNQMEFAEALFASYVEENEVYFDMGLLNKWLNGLSKLSPAIGRFYNESRKNRKELVITLQDAILPCLADSAMATQEIHALLIGDNSISQRKKEELCAGYMKYYKRHAACVRIGLISEEAFTQWKYSAMTRNNQRCWDATSAQEHLPCGMPRDRDRVLQFCPYCV